VRIGEPARRHGISD
jgi:hypothetical protein